MSDRKYISSEIKHAFNECFSAFTSNSIGRPIALLPRSLKYFDTSTIICLTNSFLSPKCSLILFFALPPNPNLTLNLAGRVNVGPILSSKMA